MENLSNAIQLQKKRMGIYDVEEDKSYRELVDSINTKLVEIEKLQIYTLTEQEKLNIRAMNTEELLKEMLNNQNDMRKAIDILLERWG